MLLIQYKDHSGLLIDLDHETLVSKYEGLRWHRVIQMEWIPSKTQKTLIQLVDGPEPMIVKYQCENASWKRTYERKLQGLTNVSCFKIED